jgi:hypothetical protein
MTFKVYISIIDIVKYTINNSAFPMTMSFAMPNFLIYT